MLAATPAMLGGFLLLLVAFGWMGRWETVLLGGWILIGVSTCTRLGERIAVRCACGFSWPSGADRQLVQLAWSTAKARCGEAVDDIHFDRIRPNIRAHLRQLQGYLDSAVAQIGEPASRTRVTHTYDWSQLRDEKRFGRARATSEDMLQASLDLLTATAEAI